MRPLCKVRGMPNLSQTSSRVKTVERERGMRERGNGVGVMELGGTMGWILNDSFDVVQLEMAILFLLLASNQRTGPDLPDPPPHTFMIFSSIGMKHSLRLFATPRASVG